MDSQANERNHGAQPVGALLEKHGLKAKDLVAASTKQLNHKTVARAIKGRQLTKNSMGKVVEALNAAAGATYTEGDAFTYARRQAADD